MAQQSRKPIIGVEEIEAIHTSLNFSHGITEATAEEIRQIVNLMEATDDSIKIRKAIKDLAASVAGSLRETHVSWHQQNLLPIQPVDELKATFNEAAKRPSRNQPASISWLSKN